VDTRSRSRFGRCRRSVGSFIDGIPPPLGIGSVELENGELVRGFLCEAYAVAGAEDVSRLGSWRAYVKRG
jgi:allophanate hydrolase